jgi:Domain of unknown function (DUF588)
METVEIEQPLSSTQKNVAVEKGESSRSMVYAAAPAINRWISIIDLVLRLVAIVGTLGSAIAMGTTNETLPFFTQFIQFRAEYSDLPSFT